MEFFLIVFLTLLNGIFAMSELALAASRKPRLSALAQSGDKGAESALILLDNPNQFLSTVQVGITSIGMLNGIVGEAAYSAVLAIQLQLWGLSQAVSSVTATALVVTIITFTTIIFGELVPKRIGQLYPEIVSRWVSRPMLWLAKLAKPFVRLLSGTTGAILKLIRIDTNVVNVVTEEEITASLEEGVDAGLIEQHEHQMVRNVFQLDERTLTSLMVPRNDVAWLDASLNVEEALDFSREEAPQSGHSWYPVCKGSLDDVVGVISVAKLLAVRSEDNREEGKTLISNFVDPAIFVPETLSGMALLEQFRSKVKRFALVVDEYGVVQGLLTPLDLLEAITGELQTNQEIDAWAVQQDDGSWVLDGLMPIGELKVRLGIDNLPHEERGDYNTLAGLLMAISGQLPIQDQKILCLSWTFTILALDGKRIDRVLGQLESEPEELTTVENIL